MKTVRTYIPCTVRTVATTTSTVLCGSVITNVPITVPSNGVVVEDTKVGFENTDGTDFKDLSFD